MKNQKLRSNQHKIQLVLAGMLVAGMVGCSEGRRELANDTYVTDKGFYHSETGGFYPYPWNHYVPNMGYYGGSRGWTGSPHRITNGFSSVPRPASAGYRYAAPLPNIPPPAPRPSQIQNYRYSSPRVTAPVPATTSATVSTSTSASKPTSSPGVRSGGFGSSGSSAVS